MQIREYDAVFLFENLKRILKKARLDILILILMTLNLQRLIHILLYLAPEDPPSLKVPKLLSQPNYIRLALILSKMLYLSLLLQYVSIIFFD